jgi:hypothetical protein
MAPTFRIHYTYERFVRFKFGLPLEHDARGKARVDDFDLSYGNFGVELELFTGRGKAESWHSNKIKAYWLPWLKKTTTQLTLGDDAPFFFTSELTGCRIQIGGGPSSTVFNIAGNEGTSREWRDKQAKEHLGRHYKKIPPIL